MTESNAVRSARQEHRKRKRKQSAAYVYVMKAALPQGDRYKIGRSRDPLVRLAKVQAMSPVLVEMAAVEFFPNAPAKESALHAMFKPYRTHGEWFELDEDEFSDLWYWLVVGEE